VPDEPFGDQTPHLVEPTVFPVGGGRGGVMRRTKPRRAARDRHVHVLDKTPGGVNESRGGANQAGKPAGRRSRRRKDPPSRGAAIVACCSLDFCCEGLRPRTGWLDNVMGFLAIRPSTTTILDPPVAQKHWRQAPNRRGRMVVRA